MAEPSGRPRDLEQEIEVVPALRHEDAEWKIIQQNTFTRWVNNHLKKGGQSIKKLETDFADGLCLITLAECLSHRSVGRYNKKVSFRSQRLENVSLALSFFQDKEGIKIINIDSTHIVDQNKKLILGLIWTLILHYSISVGWTAEPRDGQTEETPKQKLLNWIRGKLPHGMPLSNFTSDWNDGLALGALVNTLIPGSVPNWDTWLPENALENTQKAMKAAKERLGVEPLIAPEELIHPEIDDLSVMTFLSQFPTAKQIDSKQAEMGHVGEIPKNDSEVVSPSIFGEITDLDEYPSIKKPSQFSVCCTPRFKPLVTVIHDSGAVLPVDLVEKVPGDFVGEFRPEYVGVHNVHLRLENPAYGVVEPQSKPYQFTALPIARLCPYKDCATVGQILDFRVEDAYNGPVDFIIVNAEGIESRIPVTEVQPGVHVCSFPPTSPGLHSINVFHRKNHLDSSPFPLRVRNSIPNCSVWGRGIADSGIRVGDTVPVNVKLADSIQNCEPLFNTVVKCKATGSILPTKSFLLDDNTISFNYTPSSVGDHEVQVLYDNQPVEKPHLVIVASPSTSGIKAFGPGLVGGIAEKESVFQVDSNGEPNKLSFLIEGPSKTEISCQDKGNGTALVSYIPKLPGVYKVKVLSGGEHIPDSPFLLDVTAAEPQFHPAAARVSGLEPPLFANYKVAFTVDTKRTNVDDAPQVTIYDKDHNKVSFSQSEMSPGNHSVDFLPNHPGPYIVDCRLRGIALPGTPYSVDVKNPVDVSKLRMYGPGVEGPVVAQEPTHFTIDAKQAGAGAVEVSLIDRQGQNVDIDVLDHQDGSFTVKYTAPKPGAYQLNVVFAGEEMDPIEINVQPRVDTSGITVSGLENKANYLGEKVKIAVNASHLKAKDGGARIFIIENDSKMELPVLEKEAGVYEATYVPTHIGNGTAEIIYDKEPVMKTPIHVVAGSDPTKVVANFSKIKELLVGKLAVFNIDTKDAGEGELSVTIGGPAECSCKISDNGDGTCSAKFVPAVPGKYVIGVKYGEDKTHVPDSPFNCRADYGFHPENVYVSGLSHEVKAEEPVVFNVNTENTKDLPVSCIVPKGHLEPVIEKHDRTYRVKIVPRGDSGEAVPVQILYGDTPIKGSPFILKIARSSFPENVKILNADTDKAKVQTTEEETKIIVDTCECGECKSLGVDVLGPDGKTRKCDVRPGSVEGLYEVVFTPDQSGQYKVNLFLDGVQSNVNVTVNAVKVQQNKPSTVTVNSSSLLRFRRTHSAGTVTAVSERPNAAEIAIRSRPDSEGQVVDEVTIVPKMTGPNTIRFNYGGKEFYNFSYECLPEPTPIREEVEVYEHDYSINNNNSQKEYTTREFKFETDNSLSVNQLSAVVTMPSNKLDSAEIIDNHDGSILVKYTPKTAGQHELSIFQEGKQVQGTPVKFFVDSYGDGYATVYGPGLQQAVVGEPAAFTVCAKGSHAKELSVSIEGPAQSTIKIHDNKDSTVNVTWDPPCPGEYKVHVKLGNKEVKNSPFSVLVAGEGQKRSHLSVGSTSEVALNISQTELKGISASIKSPSGIEEPCFVRLIEGGRLGVSFTPRECGEHLITVKRDGKLLPKAPFKIKVGKDQVGDASKVEVSGDGKTRAICQQDNELFVNTSKAGFGGLSVSVQGPSKAELQCKEVKAGLIKVVYRPSEPGVYVIAIKFADHHVKDSPLTVNCTGKGAGRVKQEINKKVEQANVCLPDHEGNIYLKLTNMSPMDISARIMDPKGKTEDVEMRNQGDQFYLVKFKPHVEGTHQLSVIHKDAHVNGSPFPFTVGTFGEGGAHKVRASGAGIIRGETNSVNSFNIYSREAGPGNLTVAVEGPAKATVKFEDHKDGSCHVDYKVAVAGEYSVAVKFNDMHIPDSPFKVFIAAATGDARKLEIAQFHDNVPVGKAYTFTVLTHRAKGHLEAKVMGSPNNEFETIDIVPIEEGESYALRFIPKDCGNHYIYVTLDGAPMRDSPLRLRVGAKDLSDPTALSASGEGLISGVTGQKNEFIISSANAGAGVLTVQVDGPSKVTLDAYELDLGYKVRFTPLAPGDYFAAVKYNGIHIPGSPFKIPVSGKELGGNGYNEASFVKIDAVAKTSKGTVAVVPEYKGDASKVVAKGAGLNKFFPGRPAVFTIDTAMAGSNLLMVGVITTKGPCEEVIVKNQGSGHFSVAYRIQERVKGFIFVKYGDQGIPGSPFAIEP